MARNRPLVSWIIPSYNYDRFLPECLDACLHQRWENNSIETVADTEVIVVDDASSDDSLKTLEMYNSGFPQLTYILHDTNKGYSAAKNTAIEYSVKAHPEQKDHFFVHLDADDKPTSDSVERRLRYFLQKPQLDVVHGMALRWYGGSDTRGFNPNRYPHAQGVMMRREVYEKCGLYYERLRAKADKEMWFRIGLHPESPMPKRVKDKQIKAPVALYRKHDGQLHKQRKYVDPDLNKLIESIFKKRIKQLKREGITRENTRFLSC